MVQKAEVFCAESGADNAKIGTKNVTIVHYAQYFDDELLEYNSR